MKPHFYEPGHMTKTSHTRDCCALPESEHLPFPNGEKVTLVALRDIPRSQIRKGQTFKATRSAGDYGMKEISPARWGRIPDGPYAGTFAELQRAVIEKVRIISYTVRLEQGYSVAIPVKWAREAK